MFNYLKGKRKKEGSEKLPDLMQMSLKSKKKKKDQFLKSC